MHGDEALAVDVSNHQGSINWSQVSAAGVRYAYLKASEGRGFVDPDFSANWSATSSAGIHRGAYHFFTLCALGTDQANNFLRVARPENGALPPAVDLEILGGCRERPTEDVVEQQLSDFVRVVERAWHQPLVVYARQSWTEQYPAASLSDHQQWRTAFFVRPRSDWAIWQVHYFARVNGISGRVDLDVVRPGRLQVATR